MTNVGSSQATVHWLLKIESLDWEKIIDNGVSQSSALSLMTFSSALAGPDASTIRGCSRSRRPAGGDPLGGSTGPGAGQLVRDPEHLLDRTAVVGWTGRRSRWPSTTDAGRTRDRPIPGAGTALPLSSEPGPLDDDNAAFDRAPGADAGPYLTAFASETVEARLDPDAASTRADVQALAQAEWLPRIGSLVAQLVRILAVRPTRCSSLRTSQSHRFAWRSTRSALNAEGHDGSWRNRRLISMLRGDLGAAASVIMVGAVAYRLRKPLKKWWRQRGQLTATRRFSPPRALPGPHPDRQGFTDHHSRASRVSLP